MAQPQNLNASVDPQEEVKAPEKNPLQDKIEEMTRQLDNEKKLREQILSDPDMKAVLEAKRAGKPIKVAEVSNEPKIEKKSLKDEFGLNPEPAKRDDFNRMSNAELLDILTDSVETYVSASIDDAIQRSSSVIGGQFKNLQDNQNKLAQALVEQAKRTGAESMSKMHDDFQNYQEDVYKLVEHNGLTIEDAYILAKSKKAASVPPANELSSERPTTPASRRPFAVTRQEGESRERAGSTTKRFRDLVTGAAENVMQRSLRRQ